MQKASLTSRKLSKIIPQTTTISINRPIPAMRKKFAWHQLLIVSDYDVTFFNSQRIEAAKNSSGLTEWWKSLDKPGNLLLLFCECITSLGYFLLPGYSLILCKRMPWADFILRTLACRKNNLQALTNHFSMKTSFYKLVRGIIPQAASIGA